MTQPTKYIRIRDFSQDESNSVAGRGTLLTAGIDAELDALKTTTDQIIDNIALLQRDDGKQANGSIHVDALSAAVVGLINGNWTPQGAWVTATGYALYDMVSESNDAYVCLVAHTSGTFATDLATGKWFRIGQASYADIAALIADLASTASGKGASMIGVEDVDVNYTGVKNLEAILQEIGPANKYGKKGSNIASAATTDLGASSGEYVVVTGAVTITSLGTGAPIGTKREVHFTGAPLITNNANIILPTGRDYRVVAGDIITFRYTAANEWKAIHIVERNGAWEPALYDGTHIDKGATYSTSNKATYRKIWDTVYIHGTLALSSLGTLAGVGASIGGYPHACAGVYKSSLTISRASNLVTINGGDLDGRIGLYASFIDLIVDGNTSVSISNISANTQIEFGGFYIASNA